jgi:hypothetical protein
MLQALEQIRRMRGGAQSHLMRCSDGYYYVVKFQNNPQHRRILVNEMLGTKLAARLGLPTVPVAIVEVSEELIRLTPELAMELPRTRIACQPGLQFGARYPGDPRQVTLHDFLPDEQLREVENLHEFAGMLVFDKWTCNTNGRQTVFFDERKVERDEATVRYKTRMIDQGFASTPGNGIFRMRRCAACMPATASIWGVTGMESFAPWLELLEKRLSERMLDEIGREIPPAWYEDDYDALVRLLEQLHRRRPRVPDLILEAKKSSRQPFPNWM